MGRKSALSDRQWKDIETRHLLHGESASSLAREYGITEAAIRKRFGSTRTNAKSLAVQLVAIESEINKCDLGTKTLIRTYADRLMAIQNTAGDVAVSGMKIAKRVSEAMSNQLNTMSDAQLMDAEQMKPLMAAGMVANVHASLGLDLIKIAARTKEDPSIERKIVFVNDPEQQ